MKEFLVALAIVFGVGLIVIYPLAVIWSLNTLFGLTIPYTFSAWCATMILVGVFAANIVVKKN